MLPEILPAVAGALPAGTPLPAGDAERREQAQVEAWRSRLDDARTRQTAQMRRIVRWRRYLAGERSRQRNLVPWLPDDDVQSAPDALDGGQDQVLTNYIFSAFESALPSIYAQNPEVMVLPAPSVGDTRYEFVRNFARTAEIVLKHYFTRAKLKARMKSAARTAMAAGFAALKMGYYRDWATDTVLRERTPDVQEAIHRLGALLAERQAPTTTPDRADVLDGEIRDLQRAVTMQTQAVVAEGLALDAVDPVDLVIDPALRDLQDYEQAAWIAQIVWMTQDDAKARFGLTEAEAGQITQGGRTAAAPGGGGDPGDGDDDGEEWGGLVDAQGHPLRSHERARLVRVAEIWHRGRQTVYTFIDGLKRWAREPFQPERQPERWYPFFLLAFNVVDHKLWPLSDVHMLMGNQEITERTRRRFYLHRYRAVQKYMFDAGRLSEADAKKFAGASVGEYVPVTMDGPGDTPLSNLIAAPTVVPPDPRVYDVSPTRSDMEVTFGVGDAQQGSVRVAKTATEARQLEATLTGRMQERQSELEDLVGEMGRAALQILLMEAPPDHVVRIAGEEAVWLPLSREQITAPERQTLYDMVSVEIKAGSAGKPNDDLARQQWIELLPILRESVMQVQQLRMVGDEVGAQAVIELVKETFARLDERINPERFMPGGMIQPGMVLPPELQQAAAAGVPIGASGTGASGTGGGIMPGAGVGLQPPGAPGRPGNTGSVPPVPGGVGARVEP